MSKEYDVVVIGGGIQGCGVAQAAVSAGFSTLLIEQNTWGSATSSSSSKLIHGGLRYLQTSQFSLVRECLEEREWMLESIPDLVKPNWFYFPLYKSGTIRPWKLHSGLLLYQALCGYSKYGKFKRIPRYKWKKLDGLNTDGLEAVFAYQDAQTDDKQLTHLIQKSAAKLGAECMEHTRLNRAAKFQDGYQVCYKQDGVETCIKTQLIVNASGPWVNHTLACITPAIEPIKIDLVQGTHIIIDERISDRCFYLQAPTDQRIVFVLPWKDKTMIGTTETHFKGKPEDCEPLQSEIDYLLFTVKHYFANQPLTVIDSFSGLRVLPQSEEKSFFRPRDAVIKVDERLVSIYGGKLTTWRSTAEDVLNEIEIQLGQRDSINTHLIDLQ